MKKKAMNQNYKFTIKDNIDYFIFSIYNILSMIKFQCSFKLKKELKKNRKFKDIHKNQRCFILGTGPSLSKVNFSDLEGEILFGVNNLFKMENMPKLTYYVMVDSIYVKDSKYKKDLETFLKNMKDIDVFLDASFIKEIEKSEYNFKNLYFLNAKLYQFKNKMSCCLDSNMYICYNVVSVSILIAMYMGFNEIYLLGCDYNSFVVEMDEHCYDEKNEIKIERSSNLADHLKWYSKTTYAHYAIAELALKNNQKIINLTADSLLDAYSKRTK